MGHVWVFRIVENDVDLRQFASECGKFGSEYVTCIFEMMLEHN